MINYDYQQQKNEITQLIRSLKKYYMLAYKEFLFYPEGLKVKKGEQFTKYTLNVPEYITEIHGKFSITVDYKGIIVDIQPKKHLTDGYRVDLKLYKGIFVYDIKDQFKVDLMEAKRNENL